MAPSSLLGSNPNEMPLLEEDVVPTDPRRAFATEFRVEKYTPPDLVGDNVRHRPNYVEITEKNFLWVKTVSTVRFKLLQEPCEAKFLLYKGDFVTHAVHMGEVFVDMKDLGLQLVDGERREMRVKLPGIKLAPGPYVLYVVADGIPSVGQFVTVRTE